MKTHIFLLTMILMSWGRIGEAQTQKNEMLLAQLQGTWRTTAQDAQGNQFTITKVVDGRRETMRTERAGVVLHEHVVDFEVKSTDHVLVFTYRNYTITQGPNQGFVRKEPVSYIFRVTDSEWICIEGSMKGDEGKVRVVTYERVKNEVNGLSND